MKVTWLCSLSKCLIVPHPPFLGCCEMIKCQTYSCVCNRVSLSVNGLVWLISGSRAAESPELSAFWHNAMPSAGMYFQFAASPHSLHAFPGLSEHFSCTVAVTFAG